MSLFKNKTFLWVLVLSVTFYLLSAPVAQAGSIIGDIFSGIGDIISVAIDVVSIAANVVINAPLAIFEIGIGQVTGIT